MKRISKALVAVAVVVTALCATLTGVVGAVGGEARDAGTANLDEASVVTGTTVSLEDKTFTIDGTSYTVTPIAYFPSGRAEKTNRLVVSDAGKYTIEYRVEANGAILQSEKESFVAYDPTYVISGDGSAEYTTVNGVSGLKVVLKEDSSITFQKVMDIRDVTDLDVLVDAFVLPSVVGEADFKKLVFRFEDIYDASNVLTVTVAGNLNDGDTQKTFAYALAGAGAQTLTGYEKNLDKLHRDDTWGTPFEFSFWGVNDRHISLRLDMKSKEVFAQRGISIIDLDNKQYFSQVWNGFSNGKVKLSVSAEEYSKTDATFFVTDVYGMNLEDPYLIPEAGPKTTIDYGAYAEDGLPAGVVGCGYRIFDATCYDEFSLKNKIGTTVYYRYGESDAHEVLVRDGYFYPERAGDYTIVYTAENIFGLKTVTLSPTIRVKPSASPIYVNIHSDYLQAEGKVGEYIRLPGYSVAGGDGKLRIDVSVLNERGPVVTDGKGFTPQEPGTYCVIYEAVDYNGNVGMSVYNIEVALYDGAVFTDTPELPEYLLGGFTYTFPRVTGRNYRNGQETVANIKIVRPDGTEVTAGSDGGVTIDTADAYVDIVYYIGDASISFRKTVIPTKTADGKINIIRYFLTDAGITCDVDENGILLNADKDGGVRFVQELLSEGFQLNFSCIPEASNFTALNIRLVDVNDASHVIVIRLSNEAGGTFVTVNGQQRTECKQGFSASQSNAFELNYQNGKVTVGGATITVFDEGGNAAAGFSAGLAYLDISFEGVRGNSSVILKNLNGQPLNSRILLDTVKPRLTLLDDYGGVFRLGDTIRISRAVAKDVLTPCIEFYMTVTGPDGEIVTSLDGVRLDRVSPDRAYEIKLDSFGYYKVVYSAKDDNNKAQVYQYGINVFDFSPVELGFSSTLPEKASVGDRLTLPAVTAPEGVTVWGYFCDHLGRYTRLTDDIKSVIFSEKGTYRIIYLAVSESGASNTYIFEIVVS